MLTFFTTSAAVKNDHLRMPEAKMASAKDSGRVKKGKTVT